MADWSKFKGTLPYASEPLGVYQPILGWEGQNGRGRAARQVVSRFGAAIDSLARDPRFPVTAVAEPWSLQPSPPIASGGPSTLLLNLVAAQANTVRGNAPSLNAGQWRAVLNASSLQGYLRQTLDRLPAAPVDAVMAAGAQRGDVDRDQLSRRLTAAASVLGYMSLSAPDALNLLFFTKAANWQKQLNFIDPFAGFSADARQAVLSPVGLLHLYRQYYFEFESFLGPPVGHVWVSPGGTLEVIEVNVRKTTVDSTSETSTEMTKTSELSTTNQDELSDAVKQENSNDVRLGARASAGFNAVVAHGEASASFDLDESRKTSSELTHKQTRQQSEKLSSEIRQNFKTTFRTTTETTDTSSRRYVLQNTSDKLINYELRRKMRQVGIQLQHIATQLCWQMYVDRPGQYLSTSELVSVAQPADVDIGPPPPDAPDYPAPQEVDFDIEIPFEDLGKADDDRGRRFDYGSCQADGGDGTIQYKFDFDNAPPPGMQLSQVVLEGSPRKFNPDHDLPDPFQVQLAVDSSLGGIAAGRFQLTLQHVNFREQDRIPITVKLVYTASADTIAKNQAEYQAHVADYDAAKSRAQHEAYVNAVRDRINAVGEVAVRPYDDLRNEERQVVYRRLIEALTKGTNTTQDDEVHITSELLRRYFDIDNMLFFIAPDWWRPSAIQYYSESMVTSGSGGIANPYVLSDADKVGWAPAAGPEPYFVTETSRPAPLGSSLGWLLQMDGDNLRNAFLNAAWVKAVMPIRYGQEKRVLDWLRAHVEGSQGLDGIYESGPPEWNGKTIGDVLDLLADQVNALNDQATHVDAQAGAQPTETVFQNGFDPLAGGVRVDAKPFEVFDQWIEVLPTDQVVAVEYTIP